MLWDRIDPERRAAHIDSLRRAVERMRAEIAPGAETRNAEFLPVYEAVIELLEREDARLAGTPWRRPSRWPSLRRLAVDFVVAALLLTPLDALQLWRGIEVGSSPSWLTAIRFGLVGLVLGLFAPSIDPKPHPQGTVGTAIDVLLFVVGYLVTLSGSATWTTWILLAMFLFAWLRAVLIGIKNTELSLFFVLLGLGGPLVELAGVKLGAFHYAGVELIPSWLPFLWLLGAFPARDLFAGRRPT